MRSAGLLEVAPLVEPRWHTRSKSDYTLGPEVAELIAGCRDDIGPYVMDPEQRLLLDDWFAYRISEDGVDRLAHFECAVIAARQDMKTGALKAAALGKIYICEQRLVVWTAHRGIAVAEAYRDLKKLIQSNPDLEAELVGFNDQPGKEELEFTGDRRIIFKVRTSNNVQSLAGDTVILDEGYMVAPEHLLALLPLLAARPDPQVLWGSSAGLKHSAPLRAVRKRGRLGEARLCYAEWAAEHRPCATDYCMHYPGTPGCAIDDVELWLQANVAITRGRKSIETIASLRKAFEGSPLDFASQFLVWWDDPPGEEGEVPFTPQAWMQLTDLGAEISGPLTFVLDVAPKGSMSSITVTGVGRDGIPVTEITARGGVLDYRPGVGWLIPRLVELGEKWPGFEVVVLGGSVAEALVPAIENAGVRVDVLPASEYPRACVWLKSQFDESGKAGAEPRFHHTGQEELSRAVAALRPKYSATRDTFTWIRATPTADICPAVGMTVGQWKNQTAGGVSAYETRGVMVV